MNDEDLYKAKQEWLGKVMASKHSHAIKTFAFCIYKRMYGLKITSHPMTDDIKEDGGFASSGHFTEYRRALVDCGAITAVLDYHTRKATNKNYEYTLCLDWDGAVAPTGKSRSTSGNSHSTYGESRSTTGASNTTNNTSTNTASKTSKNAPVLADAPTVTFERTELSGAYLYTMEDVSSSSNKELGGIEYHVDSNGVTKAPAVAPTEVQQDTGENRPVDRDPRRAAQEWADSFWK